MKNKLNEGKKQEVFDERLKNNSMNIINHGIENREAHCRICKFSCRGKDTLKKAKSHSQETGHTIDVYTENWKEINFCGKNKLGK